MCTRDLEIRTGKDILENDGCLLFLAALKAMKGRRGEQEVGIALSQRVLASWKRRDLFYMMILVADHCCQTAASRYKWKMGLHLPCISLLPCWKL